jgi:hypothetical protein
VFKILWVERERCLIVVVLFELELVAGISRSHGRGTVAVLHPVQVREVAEEVFAARKIPGPGREQPDIVGEDVKRKQVLAYNLCVHFISV